MVLFKLSALTMSHARILLATPAKRNVHTWGYAFIISTVPLSYMAGDNEKLVYLQKYAPSLSLFVYDSVVKTTPRVPSWQKIKHSIL